MTGGRSRPRSVSATYRLLPPSRPAARGSAASTRPDSAGRSACCSVVRGPALARCGAVRRSARPGAGPERLPRFTVFQPWPDSIATDNTCVPTCYIQQCGSRFGARGGIVTAHKIRRSMLAGRDRPADGSRTARQRAGHDVPGLVEPRVTRRQGTVCGPCAGSPLIASSRCSAATRPMSSRHMLTRQLRVAAGGGGYRDDSVHRGLRGAAAVLRPRPGLRGSQKRPALSRADRRSQGLTGALRADPGRGLVRR